MKNTASDWAIERIGHDKTRKLIMISLEEMMNATNAEKSLEFLPFIISGF